MKITVCELNNDPQRLADDWSRLTAHVQAAGSDLVVLPELPFYPWWMLDQTPDIAAWSAAVAAHESWQQRFAELSPAAAITSFPTEESGARYNEALLWDGGHRMWGHRKHYLPDEAGFRESSWYQRGDGALRPLAFRNAAVGVLLCSELWSFESARRYGTLGAHLIASPRATGKQSVEKWLVAGRAAALTSGAFSVSSNRSGRADRGIEFGGTGWIIDPDGKILGTTSADQPFLTLDVDLAHAERAKQTYPRNAINVA